MPPQEILEMQVSSSLSHKDDSSQNQPAISNSTEATDTAVEPETECLWYFAIGAMVNPISLRNRNIFPQASRPAELIDHRINFFGSIGVAEAVPEVGSSFHGVLHRVDHDTMERLDKIERDYVKKSATARCYDGTEIECVVYCRPHNNSLNVDKIAAGEAEAELSSPSPIMEGNNNVPTHIFKPLSRQASLDSSEFVTRNREGILPDDTPKERRVERRHSLEHIDMSGIVIGHGDSAGGSEGSSHAGGDIGGHDSFASLNSYSVSLLAADQPPLERYLEILILGCEHYGVSEEYIGFLRSHESQPRPKPGEFQSFGNPSAGVDAPTLSLEEVEKCDGEDGRPLRVTFCGRVLECTLPHDSAVWNEFVEIHKQVGHVGEIYISRVAYDPKYGLPERLEDFTREHAAYLEDLMWRYMTFTGLPDAWRAIAWFEQSYKDT